MRYNFEWDSIKAKQNIKKYKVSFEHTTQIFLAPFAISIFDIKHSENEDRWITLGKGSNNVLLVVIHTFYQKESNQTSIRIISARKATKRKSKQYYQKY